MNYDTLIDSTFTQSRIAAGLPLTWVVRQSSGSSIVPGPSVPPGRAPRWTESEDAFLRENLNTLTDVEIAHTLGRTPEAVHIRWRRDLALRGRSRQPNEFTFGQVAIGLGVDDHMLVKLFRRGLIPCRILPAARVTRVISRLTLLRWMLTPANWIYFKPAQVAAFRSSRSPSVDVAWWQKSRRLLDLRVARWNDEWWTSGQVARHYGIDHKLVRNHASAGTLPAVRWNNWRIRRSDALAHTFYIDKGNNWKGVYTPRADAFLLLARGVGLSYKTIDALMGTHSAAAHLNVLIKNRVIPNLIRSQNIPAIYRSQTMLADWKTDDNRRRFPSVYRAMHLFQTCPQSATYADRRIVSSVFAAWAGAMGTCAAHKHLTRTLSFASFTTLRLTAIYHRLRRDGIDPYQPLSKHVSALAKKSNKAH